jgi:hypothetical protein
MEKGELVYVLVDTPIYDHPVSIDDQASAIRHYIGLAKRGQHALVLSDPDVWKTMSLQGWSNPWSRVLLEGRAVWVANRYIDALVQPTE